MSTVYLVDDDDAIRDALGWLMQSRNVAWRGFASAEEFLAAWHAEGPAMTGCLLVDIRMGGISGLQLFDLLREEACPLPTLFLTGHGDVPMAVAALKKGAFDFFEKPFNDNDLVNRILEALALDASQRSAQAGQETVNGRLAKLSSRERQVMELVLLGRMNKIIADELQISMRTVEVHRARLFEKMGVRTAVELARVLGDKR
jgi:two-component system response regulator DctR